VNVALSFYDWLALFVQFLSLSLLAVGGAITTAPEMHRYMVLQQHWLSDAQFTSSIALAQAAPGPNVLFIALFGWNLGLNAAGGSGAGVHAIVLGLMGAAITLFGILLPSTTLTYVAARWGHRNRELRAVRAFKQGMAPIVVALLIATGWILLPPAAGAEPHWHLWLVGAVSAILIWRTRIHMLWLLGAGALAGWLGWI